MLVLSVLTVQWEVRLDLLGFDGIRVATQVLCLFGNGPTTYWGSGLKYALSATHPPFFAYCEVFHLLGAQYLCGYGLLVLRTPSHRDGTLHLRKVLNCVDMGLGGRLRCYFLILGIS